MSPDSVLVGWTNKPTLTVQREPTDTPRLYFNYFFLEQAKGYVKALVTSSTRRKRLRVLMDYLCFATIFYLIPSYVARGRIFFCTS